MGLIALGVVLILLVVCFNWWQERRMRQRMQEHFPEGEHDPLMGGGSMAAMGRREPGLGFDTQPAEEPDEALEVDPTCEAVIDIRFAQPVSGTALHAALQPVRAAGAKPVRWLAETQDGHHHPRARDEDSYVSVQLAVLLANRSGALTDIEWSQLWAQSQQLAEQFDGTVEAPEQAPTLEQAKRLDALCAGLDAQVVLAVQLPAPVSGQELLPVIRDAGFLSHGRHLAWMAGSGVPRFSLLFDGVPVADRVDEQVSRLDLQLDLPCSEADEQAFSRMASVGRDLATRLQGELLDDQGRPVDPAADATVDAQLHGLYANLERAGFPAGDARTLRLFS